MKVYEHDPRWPAWLNRLLNAAARDPAQLRSRAVAWGANARTSERPDWRSLEIIDEARSRSLYHNGIVFVRLVWPWPGLWIHLRLSRHARHQFGAGWKYPSGRLGCNLRVHHRDDEAERGTTGPNYGQARGWARGTA